MNSLKVTEDARLYVRSIFNQTPLAGRVHRKKVAAETAVHMPLGTIDILRKHLCSTNLNLTTLFFSIEIFLRQNNFMYILTKISCCSLKFLVHKEKKFSKNS